MLEQIKEALEKATPGRRYEFGAKVKVEYNAPEWLRYLIGEVERLEKKNGEYKQKYSNLCETMDTQVLELQKALEWYANKVNYLPYRLIDLQENVIADQGERARTALQSIQGGNKE